jgi:hypothetical protein
VPRRCRKLIYLFLAFLGWGAALGGVIAMFKLFSDCSLPTFFVAFTLCQGVILTVLSCEPRSLR